MKRLLLLVLLLPFVQCSKNDGDEKACYVCNAYYENVYDNGQPWKDTVTVYPCETKDFVDAIIKNGTGTGRKYEIVDGDTLYYNFKAVTTCTRK